MRRSIIILAIAGQLAGCASAGTRAALDDAKVRCAAGDPHQCSMAQVWQDRADHEASENAGKVALGVALVPLFILAAVAAGAGQQHDTVYIVRRHGWR